jgi:hypothetical protein
MEPNAPWSDWHVHTWLSDGTSPPLEVVRAAARVGLRELAITDHDGVDAHRVEAVGHAAREVGITLVTGVEMDCQVGDAGVEILGFGFDPRNVALVERLARVQAQRRERFLFHCDVLGRHLGRPIPPDDVAPAHTVAVTTAHLFRYGSAHGLVCQDDYRAFRRQLDSLGQAPAVERPTLAEAVALVRGAGGFSVLAHPLYYDEVPGLEPLLRAAAAAGCVGVQLGHPYQGDPGETAARLHRLMSLATRHLPAPVVTTRGTDVHDLAEWSDRLRHLAACEGREA